MNGTRRQRQTALLAGLALGLAALLMWAVSPGPRSPDERGRSDVAGGSASTGARGAQAVATPPETPPVSDDGLEEPIGAQGDEPQPDRPAQLSPRDRREAGRMKRGAIRFARRFLAAFLKYDSGYTSPRIRRELRRTVEAGFARLLLAEQATRPDRDRQRLLGLSGTVDLAGQFVSVRARIARGATRSLLWIKVKRVEHRWLVVELN